MPAGAIVYDPAYRDHDTGDHIESKSRVDAIMERIREDERASTTRGIISNPKAE